MAADPSSGCHGDVGSSAVEYGLLVAALASVIVLVVFALGLFVKGSFKDTCDAIAKPGYIVPANAAGVSSDCNQ